MKAIATTAAVFSILCFACGGYETPASSPTTTSAATISPTATFAEQAAAGHGLFEDHCASCHGSSGEGVDAPRLVGMQQGALPLAPAPTAKYRKNEFHTAMDVAAFVTKNMPPKAPGSLREDQYWAILAFDLKANGVDLGQKHLDATTAPGVVIHP